MLRSPLVPITCAVLLAGHITPAYAQESAIDLDRCRELKAKQEVGSSLSDEDLSSLATCLSDAQKLEGGEGLLDSIIIYPLEQAVSPPQLEDFWMRGEEG